MARLKDEAARAARREYYRAWRKKNKAHLDEYQENYWYKAAAKMAEDYPNTPNEVPANDT